MKFRVTVDKMRAVHKSRVGDLEVGAHGTEIMFVLEVDTSDSIFTMDAETAEQLAREINGAVAVARVRR